MARSANFELSIRCILLLGLVWRNFARWVIFIFYWWCSRGTLSRCSRNPWVPRNPGWKSLLYGL